MTQAIPELFQFRYAMFPEKARWALDVKGIEHGRRAVIPGLHPPTMIKLAKQAAISLETVQAGLDRIEQLSANTGYLVGDSFTAADLTAATVFNVCCFPDEYPVPIPQPRPENLQHWLQRWAEHPATAWVQRIYAQHRPRSVASYDKASNAD
jgi:glutathione S-transferase